MGFRETGGLPFLFLGRGEISHFLLVRAEIGLILVRFYLQGEGRLGFLILGRGEINQFNFRESGDGTPMQSLINNIKKQNISIIDFDDI